MYIYSLHGYEENTVLQHEHKFTRKKFTEMCKEAPIIEEYGLKAYDSLTIRNYLIKKYGFKEVKYTAGFFVDADVVE